MNPEELLRETLAERAESTAITPTPPQRIQERARFARRRQGVWVGAAAAATVAVLAGSFALLDGHEPRGIQPGGEVTTSRSTTSAKVDAAAEPLTVSGLPTGVAPKVAWADGRDVHLGDGTVLAGVLPQGTHAFATMGSGVLAAYGEKVAFYHADGTRGPREFSLQGSLATSPERRAVAWAGPDGKVTVVQNEGDERYDMGVIPGKGPFDAVAVSTEDCVEGRSNDGGCMVMVNDKGADPAAYYTSSHGLIDRLNDTFLATTASRWPLQAGLVSISDEGTCSEMLKRQRTAWETCDFSISDFSPDGAHVYASGSYGDGLGDGDAAILTSEEGRVVLHRQSDERDQAIVTDHTWEDDAHVLLVVLSKGQWSIVRMGLDGSMEYAVAPRAGDEYESPFLLRS